MEKRNSKSEIDLYVINKVKEYRLNADISQAKLANELDKSLSFIGAIESPRYRAKYNIQHLNQLAKLFGCSIKDFFPELPL
ncbi:helix-turn-helix transcriptional regulator [Pedobacter fastidiosus]|uniref:Helix-turn-helix transcriptional regulator n=1 Tax=Pedobacter fastidiosus TaxID=2765361 RepID=A0ABR7KXE7_9SPHI|nr:helix-turn-helix transcriptional regulator [Pedobacter fastidiosus]MBC6112505.1 helix-turn-helix transcriptional regulator [Pedobacter fastidiosus]